MTYNDVIVINQARPTPSNPKHVQLKQLARCCQIHISNLAEKRHSEAKKKHDEEVQRMKQAGPPGAPKAQGRRRAGRQCSRQVDT